MDANFTLLATVVRRPHLCHPLFYFFRLLFLEPPPLSLRTVDRDPRATKLIPKAKSIDQAPKASRGIYQFFFIFVPQRDKILNLKQQSDSKQGSN